MTSTAVRVGLRVRPLAQREQLTNCAECLSFIPNEPQILIGTDKSFTYDYVFDPNTPQSQVYKTAADPLLDKFVQGFNATILAYGQTGSGKTYSMGTSLENSTDPQNEGIVPRCIVDMFQKLQERTETTTDFKYEVYVSFLELYNEELIDLLNPHTANKRKGNATANPVEVTIREDVAGNIYWSGVKEEQCFTPDELLGFLAKGSLCRTTGSTDMNTVSSRSHAVFSVILKQQRPEHDDAVPTKMQSITSKFHFVDLAGSERLKRTNAQGDRAKEGIAINAGLLALGNVISALGDESRRTAHVPYRDSKLTRLLQDSLGGNSQTLMLACVSPADSNFMETLNTLKYANRARNIKNRVTINQDFAGSSMEVNQLRAQIARLRLEMASMRQEPSAYGSQEDENRALKAEVGRLKERVQGLSNDLIQTTSERDTLALERELQDFLAESQDTSETFDLQALPKKKLETHPLIVQYQKTIQDLNRELGDTRDRLVFLESVKSIVPSHSVLDKFSDLHQSPSPSSRPPRHHGISHSNSNRRRRNGRSSSNTSNNPSVSIRSRPVPKYTKRSTPSKSSSLKSRHYSKKKSTLDTVYQEEDYLDEDENATEIHQEVKDSIAKARAEILKGIQVLEFIKPLEETTTAWEEELKAFEEDARLCAGNMDPMESDEGNFTLSSHSPTRSDQDDFDDDIMSLSVPLWTETDPSVTRMGKEEDASSVALTDRTGSSAASQNSRPSVAHTNPKTDTQLARMLHQIQADIKVKEELVNHLEKSENAYSHMRRKYDEKMEYLQQQLTELQRERDTAITRNKTTGSGKSDPAQQRDKQQLLEIKNAYEAKMKQLLMEIQELKRKYAQTTMTMQATRNQNESLLRSLRVNVETLKVEKKRMVKRMKQEAERVRDQMTGQERKIQQLQRLNAEGTMARRRLEREHEAQKQTLKRRSEEMMLNHGQLKQLTSMLKKAIREGGVLDERLLGKVSHIMGGSFAMFARGGSQSTTISRKSRNKNPIPAHVRATRKKQLLDRALYQYIQGKQAVVEMEQLLVRRERLAAEKLDLVEERKHIYLAEKETAQVMSQSMDTMALDFTDERIDLIEAEISYLSARIRALQSEAAGEAISDEDNINACVTESRPEKRVTFADEIVTSAAPNNDWTDMDTLEEQFNVPANAAPEIAYDITAKLLKTLEPDECKSIAEALVDDIMNVRMSECNRQVTMQNLEKTVQDLRRTLIVMKRAAIATTIENERRIRKLEERNDPNKDDQDSAIDVKIEEYINGGNTIFDKIYEDGLRGMITTPEPGVDFSFNEPTSPGSSIASYDGAIGINEDVLMLPLPTPLTSPKIIAPSRPQTLGSSGVKPPVSLVDTLSSRTQLVNRELTPSPDRFYNMIQKRMSWQQRMGGSESPIPMTMVSPAEFQRYTTDRESSTSSIHSNHFRRSSVQSEYSSGHSQTSSQEANRKRAFSLQQPPVPTRRRASLRELSLMGTAGALNAKTGHGSSIHSGSSDYDSGYEPTSPLATMSYQQRNTLGQRRSQQFYPIGPGQPLMMERAASASSISSSGNNVFDRLSQTSTRASRAKMAHRYSSSSIEDLRQQWEMERNASSLSGSYCEE
ncbi:hypothetical protein BDF14DRAFT_1865224 [Spinellus fusiger]|nr:hypothetical protein BDF14DRAFT_1865224 [Spinellus fusiger]